MFIIIDFRERKEESKTSIGCLHTHPIWGSNQNRQVCALTGTQTHNPWCAEDTATN